MLKKELRDILAQRAPNSGETWLDFLNLQHNDTTLQVGFPHVYFAIWFNTHKRILFEEILNERFSDGSMPYVVYEQAHWGQGYGMAQTAPVSSRQNGMSALGLNSDYIHTNLTEDPFADFIINGKNIFPLDTAKKISELKPNWAYNPFLLCGRSGTGKSHILRAMATTMARHSSANRIICTTAALFCAEEPDWMQKPDQFWQHYDALLLDDIQDLVGNVTCQHKLIAYMETCPRTCSEKQNKTVEQPAPQRARQMVFTCSGQPQTLKNLDERLRSRLESSLVVELMEPDLDVRMRYLQAMSKKRSLALTRDQLLYLAQRCPQIRLLQGLLLKIEAFRTLNGQELSGKDLENIVRTGVADKTLGCREILAEVGKCMNLRPEDVLGGKRRPDLVLARQIAMYICRHKLGLSYPELGRAFGGKDHSTVIYAIKKITKLLVSDKRVQDLVTELEIKTQ